MKLETVVRQPQNPVETPPSSMSKVSLVPSIQPHKYSTTQTLRQLYLELMRPHLKYAAPVWFPHLQRDIDMLEKTQKFATKVCTKLWDWSYHELLAKLHLPTLIQHRLHIDLCMSNVQNYSQADVFSTGHYDSQHHCYTQTHADPIYFRCHLHELMLISILSYLGQHLTGTHYLIMLFCHPHLVVLSIVCHCTHCSWGTLSY